MLKNSPLTVAHIDSDLRYRWIHNAHPDFAPSFYLGKRDDEIADNEGARQLIRLKEQVLKTGVAANAVIHFPLSTGEHTFSISAEPLRDSSGKTVGLTTVSFDISESQKTD